MSKRNPVAVAVLTVLTFGLYAYYWLYSTTDELKDETGREELNPLIDVLLAIVTVGLWGIWAGARNAKIAHEEMVARGHRHTDRSLAVAGVSALSLVSGWAWIVAMAMVQEDLNRLADAEPDVFSGATPYEVDDAAPVRARVDVIDAEPLEVPSTGPSRWEDAPSAPVFHSSAPMPVVY